MANKNKNAVSGEVMEAGEVDSRMRPPSEAMVVREESAPPAQRIQISDELRERLEEAKEALEDFDSIQFPIIRSKDGKFICGEGAEPVDSLEGIILYTKQNNVYFKNAYRPGVVSQPDCFARDGRIPNVEKPVHPTCKGCPMNEYESKAGSRGKACRNMRLVFILLRDSILPSVVRVPPTSLKLIDSYILNTTNTKGSYFNVMTKITSFKKEEAQSHFNWKFQAIEGVEGQAKVDMKTVRDLWLLRMKNLEAEKVMDEETPAQDDQGIPEEPAQYAGRQF